MANSIAARKYPQWAHLTRAIVVEPTDISYPPGASDGVGSFANTTVSASAEIGTICQSTVCLSPCRLTILPADPLGREYCGDAPNCGAFRSYLGYHFGCAPERSTTRGTNNLTDQRPLRGRAATASYSAKPSRGLDRNSTSPSCCCCTSICGYVQGHSTGIRAPAQEAKTASPRAGICNFADRNMCLELVKQS